jgi:hypothetical protein
MPSQPWPDHRGATVALVTHHGKELVVRPALARAGLSLVHVDRDTDTLGTFTGDTRREGSAIDAARTKASWALADAPQARFGLASEGSFGPHPFVPWAAGGHELVLLLDRVTGIELRGDDVTGETNFSARAVMTHADAVEFARGAGFPSHGVFVDRLLATDQTFDEMVSAGLERGAVRLETDMRAHHNPLRQASILRALERCLEALAATCPSCAWPGFTITEAAPGLPCEDCGAPTRLPTGWWSRCPHCQFATWAPTVEARAPAGRCDGCNP